MKRFQICIVFSVVVKERSKDYTILKSSEILFFLLQESTSDQKIHDLGKFPDFVLLLQDSQRDKKQHYSEKFPDFCCFLCKSPRGIKNELHYSEKFPDFVLSSAGLKDG